MISFGLATGVDCMALGNKRGCCTRSAAGGRQAGFLDMTTELAEENSSPPSLEEN